MSAQHTKGPWMLDIRGQSDVSADLATVFGVATQPTEDGKGQAWIYIKAAVPCWEPSKDERYANAVLMASAPDLLAALQRCVDAFAVYADEEGAAEFDDGSSLGSIILASRAALAQARGDAS